MASTSAKNLGAFASALLAAVALVSCEKAPPAPPPVVAPKAPEPSAAAPAPVAPVPALETPPAVPPAPSAPPDRSPPTAPSGVTARLAGRTIELSWSASTDDVGVTGYEVAREGAVAARTSATNAAVAGLPAARQLCFTVSALDAAGNRSPPSTPACATLPDVTPPSAPGGLAATPSAAPTEIDLSWKPSTDDVGVKAYEVSSNGKVVATVAAASARATGLATARRHCFTVVAVDEAGNRSAPSAQACAATPDVTAPSVPDGVVAEARPGEVVLRWQPSSDDVGVTGYEILRGDARLATVQETTATVSGLKAATSHCFTVRALDAAENRSAPSAPACATPPDVTPPSAPGPLQATSPSETDVVLSWGAATDEVGVTGYEIYRGDALAVRATGTRAGDTGLKAGTTYCYRVRALDAAGNRGPFTEEACVTTLDLTPPSVPGNLVAEPEEPSGVRVRWQPSTDNVGVVRYEVRRESKLVGISQEPTVMEPNLPDGRSYCYTVAAFDRVGNASPVAGPACATLPDRTPPTVPGDVRSVAISGTQIHLTWSPSTDNVKVTAYEVLREGAVVLQDGRPLARVDRLSPDTDHCFTVRAVDASGNRSEPTAASCAKTAGANAITAPTNLQAKATGESEVVLTWDPSPEVGVVYVVSLDRDEKGRDAALKRTGERRIGTTQQTSLRLTGAVTREQHCYRVAAQGKDARVSPPTLPVCAKGAAAAPAPR